jgi:uncharacterized protein YndB with AHSA1/START domain
MTCRYFFGRRVESDCRPGSAWRLRTPDGSVNVQGVVREADPPRKLVLTWNVSGHPTMKDLPECIVCYELEALGSEVVRLTMTEAHPTPIPAGLLEGGRRGWPMLLSGLKTWLETGRELAIPMPGPGRQSN